MTKTPRKTHPKRAGGRAKGEASKGQGGLLWGQHWLTIVALVCVALFVATVAITNAFGWPRLIPGPLGWMAAAIAICAAGFAFTLWEHIRRFAKERRWPNLIGALIMFVCALAIDAVGVHSGIKVFGAPWLAEIVASADADLAARQGALDAARAELSAELAAIQARIDAVPAPDTSGGPANDAQEIARWSLATSADRDRLARQQQALDAMPRQVETLPPSPWIDWAIWAFAAFVELVVAFGVTILGIEIAPNFAEGEKSGRAGAQSAPESELEPMAEASATTNVSVLRPRRARSAPAKRWSGWDED